MAKKKKITPKAISKAETVQVSTFAEKPLTEPSVASQSQEQVQVETIVGFWDMQAKCERGVGSMFEVSEDRAKQLANLGLVIVL